QRGSSLQIHEQTGLPVDVVTQVGGAVAQRSPDEGPEDDDGGDDGAGSEHDALPGLAAQKPFPHCGPPTSCTRPSTPDSPGFADWIVTLKPPALSICCAKRSSAGTSGTTTCRSMTRLRKLSASMRLFGPCDSA